MSFDTKYRPLAFKDVVGQKGTIHVLKKLIQQKQVFGKSYIFAGPSGTGKTTTARILARAMLCDHVDAEGEPCNQCTSCREIIDGTTSFSFVEMDAANNSGVDTIRQIVEGLEYHTLGGKDRRIYLIDESHRLSKESMDALLKPMEDNIPGTNNKRLVCLFCTTEPEKIRDTIKARCMMFGIKEPEKDEAVERLKYICEQEQIPYEEEALEMIYSNGRGHVRDMVNALERVSRVGDVNVENAKDQLGLGAVSNYYEILLHLKTDFEKALKITRETLGMVDASTLYEGLAGAALASYRVHLGITEGLGYTDTAKAKAVYLVYGESILWIADRILGSSKKIDADVLICELVLMQRYMLTGQTLKPIELNQTIVTAVTSTAPQTPTNPAEEEKLSSPEYVKTQSKEKILQEKLEALQEMGSHGGFLNPHIGQVLEEKEEESPFEQHRKTTQVNLVPETETNVPKKKRKLNE